MDATTLNTMVGIVGSIVGIIGIIVGIIGVCAVNTAVKMNNQANANHGGTIYQAQTITQGIGEDTVHSLVNTLTKEQLCRIIIKLIPINTDNEQCMANKLKQRKFTEDDFEKLIEEIPGIYYGNTDPPESSKEGSFWLKVNVDN